MSFRGVLFHPASRYVVLLLLIPLSACRVTVTVPAGGTVLTESGNFTCSAGETCEFEITDTTFDETFTPVADTGYHFARWEPGHGHLCGGMTTPCRLQASKLKDNNVLIDSLYNDLSYTLAPRIVPTQKFNFTEVDTRLQYFLMQSPVKGFAVSIIHRDFGVVFGKAYGNYELEKVVELRSASKLASATLMMALDHKLGAGFDVQTPIGTYLPFEGVYGDRTSEQLLSQTSGIPGNAFWIRYEPHLCQFQADSDFDECGKAIYQSELFGTYPAGSKYSYGGSQWQLAGLVARHASGKPWGELFQRLIATPCDLEVFRYGNMNPSLQTLLWDGDPDNLGGSDNPNIEGGAIGNLRDYGKLLALHLNDGWCGNRQILASEAVDFMRLDRAKPSIPPEAELQGGYAMGAFITNVAGFDMGPVHVTPGALGTVAWLDSSLDYGAVFMTETEDTSYYPMIREFTGNSLIPEIRSAMIASLESIEESSAP